MPDELMVDLLLTSGADPEKVSAMQELSIDIQSFLVQRLLALGIGRREAVAVLGNIIAMNLAHEPPERMRPYLDHLALLRANYAVDIRSAPPATKRH